jgi:ribonuclease HI
MLLTIRTDANTFGANPGPCAIGIIIESDRDRLLVRTSRYIGHATNNFGEWTALIEGLRLAANLPQWAQTDQVRLYTDLLHVANQASGEWKANSANMIPLVADWARLVSSLHVPVEDHWIPRDENEGAHDAADEALEEAIRLLM